MPTAYAEDLAYVHDVGFTKYVSDIMPAALAMLRRHGVRDGLVLDLGCGSGVSTAELVKAGYEAIGVDISPSMIRLARRRAPRAKLVCQSLWGFKVPVCDAVISFGECLNYLFDKRAAVDSLTALRRLFEQAYRALRPGGVLMFDLDGPGRGQGPAPRFREAPDWAVIAQVTEDREARLLTRDIVTFRRIRGGFRRSHEVHVARLYPSADVAGLLREIGFRARVTRRFGDAVLGPGIWGFVAVKPDVKSRSGRSAKKSK